MLNKIGKALKRQLHSIMRFCKEDPLFAAILGCCFASFVCDLFRVGVGGISAVISIIAVLVLVLLYIKCMATIWAKAYTKTRLETERDFLLRMKVTELLRIRRRREQGADAGRKEVI